MSEANAHHLVLTCGEVRLLRAILKPPNESALSRQKFCRRQVPIDNVSDVTPKNLNADVGL